MSNATLQFEYNMFTRFIQKIILGNKWVNYSNGQ